MTQPTDTETFDEMVARLLSEDMDASPQEIISRVSFALRLGVNEDILLKTFGPEVLRLARENADSG